MARVINLCVILLCTTLLTFCSPASAQVPSAISGSYNYNTSGAGAIRPHAPTSVTGVVNGVANPSYTYDANGNVLSAGNKTLDWNGYNMPVNISKSASTTGGNNSPGTGTASFLYGPELSEV
jgi:hypothetical protein